MLMAATGLHWMLWLKVISKAYGPHADLAGFKLDLSEVLYTLISVKCCSCAMALLTVSLVEEHKPLLYGSSNLKFRLSCFSNQTTM